MFLNLKDQTHFSIICPLLHRNSIALLRNQLKNIGKIILNILINKIIRNNRIFYYVSLEVETGAVAAVTNFVKS